MIPFTLIRVYGSKWGFYRAVSIRKKQTTQP